MSERAGDGDGGILDPEERDGLWDLIPEVAPGEGEGESEDATGNAANYGAPGVPMSGARASIRRVYHARRPDGVRVPVLARWRGEWYRWDGTCWRVLSDEVLRAELYAWLEHATYKAPVVKSGAVVGYADKPWNPKKTSVGELMTALAAIVQQPDELEWGTWRDGSDRGRYVACRNVLVDPLTGGTLAHDPVYFNGFSLDFDYDPSAGCPGWLGFLESVWPGDTESPELLRQWFGYVLSGRTDLQKFMYFKGLSRSGKGTIVRILEALLGSENTCGTDFAAFGQGGFGMELLVGRQLVTFGDVRYTGDQRTAQTAISKILSITGEDKLHIDRKYKTPWTGTVPTRMMLLSNEMPWFKDSSSAIVGRMLLLVFKQSFLGREDHTLEVRLRQELAGIFNWALAGYRELVIADGRFVAPGSSREVLEEFGESVSPIGTWLRENYEPGTEADEMGSGGLYLAWCAWCEENGYKAGAVNGFLRLVQTVWPEVKRCKNLISDGEGGRVKGWSGIRVKSTKPPGPGA